jgi:hypothetical protein
MTHASAFEEACQFLSCYLEMEHPGYTTRDVLVGIKRLQAITGEGDDKRAAGTSRVRAAAWTARRTRTTDGDERGEYAYS